MVDQELYIRRHRVPGIDAKMCGPCDFRVHGVFSSVKLMVWCFGILQGHRYLGWTTSTHPWECEDSKAGDQGGLSFLRDRESSVKSGYHYLAYSSRYTQDLLYPLCRPFGQIGSWVSLYLPNFLRSYQWENNSFLLFLSPPSILSPFPFCFLFLYLSPHRFTSF